MLVLMICRTYAAAFNRLSDMLESGELLARDTPAIVLSRHGWLIQVRAH